MAAISKEAKMNVKGFDRDRSGMTFAEFIFSNLAREKVCENTRSKTWYSASISITYSDRLAGGLSSTPAISFLSFFIN